MLERPHVGASPFTTHVEEGVCSDAEQPGPHARAWLERLESIQRSQESLLRQVFGVVTVTAQRVEESIYTRPMLIRDGREVQGAGRHRPFRRAGFVRGQRSLLSTIIPEPLGRS